MKTPAPAVPTPSSLPRQVLVWHAEKDESRVEPSVEHAARFLKVAPDAIRSAIDTGEMVGGWFVDWQAIPH